MRKHHIYTGLFVLLFLFSPLADSAMAKEKDEASSFRPFIPKESYSSRKGPIKTRAGESTNLDVELLMDGYARIGVAEVRYVSERCRRKKGEDRCSPVKHRNSPTEELKKLAAKSGGDLLVVTADKKDERVYKSGEECSSWGETSRYERRTDWSTRTETLSLVTQPYCTGYSRYREVDVLEVSSGVVWRKDVALAREQLFGIRLAAGATVGDLELIKEALDNGARVNRADMDGNHPLARAAYSGHEEVVRYLLEAGADANTRGIGMPPLYRAAEGGHLAIFAMLGEKGAKKNFKEPQTKKTLMHAAAKGGNEQIVRSLLDAGIKADAADRDGVTPLMYAAAGGHEEAARLLLDNGAKVNRISKLYTDLFAKWSPVHFAAYLGDLPTIKLLLERGADAELEEERGYTPLKLARSALKMEVFDLESARDSDMDAGLLKLYEESVVKRRSVIRLLDTFVNGHYGYIDKAGKWVLLPRYMSGSPFKEGRAAVKLTKDGKWGYMDHAGKMIVKPTYWEVGDFSEGLAKVTVDDNTREGLSGYIDKSGRLVIPARYRSADRFSEGLAPVKEKESDKGEGKYGFIDRSGKWVIKPAFAKASIFSEGLAPFSPKGYQWGFIDKKGKVVIEPAYGFEGFWSATSPFTEGRSAVNISGKVYSYIDKSGKVVGPHRFRETFRFSEGLAAALDKRWGFIDQTGNWAIGQNFWFVSIMGGFSEGRCAVAIKEKKWAYIDKTGNFISEKRYQAAGPFVDGVAWVKVDELYGLIDRDENFLIKPHYASASIFSEGLAAVKIKGQQVLDLLGP